MQYSQFGKAVLIGVFTGSFSSASGQHALFVRTSAIISDEFLPIDEFNLFFNDNNTDNDSNLNEENEGNRESHFKREIIVHQEQASTNDSLIDEAMPTTEADSDEAGSGSNKKKKKKDEGPTAMAIISYIGLGFIALVISSACIIVSIFERRT